MALIANKFIQTDGTPSGGDQTMQSTGWGEDAGGLLNNGTISLPKIDGDNGDAIVSNGSGVGDYKTINKSTTINSGQTVTAIGAAESIYKLDASGGGFTIVLPALSAVQGHKFTFIKMDSANTQIVIDGDGTEVINGELTDRLVSQYDSITILANSSAWFIVAGHFSAKSLFVDRGGSGGQSISSGVVTVVEFDNVLVDTGDFFDDVTNFDYTPGNAIFQMNLSLEILGLGNNDFVEICIRKDAVNIACARQYATQVNQDITVTLAELTSNTDPSSGSYDITVEHDQGGNLNVSSNATKTFWKIVRIA